MQSSTSTSTFLPVPRRQRSSNRPSAFSPWESTTTSASQHTNIASRPFPIMPKRVSSGQKELRHEGKLPPTDVSVTLTRARSTTSPARPVHIPSRRRAGSDAKDHPPDSKISLVEEPPVAFPRVNAATDSRVTLVEETTVTIHRTMPKTATPDVDISATFPRAKIELAHGPLPTFKSTSSSSAIHLIRKKSGELLKPSLRARTKSAPSTPGSCSKAVRFDQELEHIRLFRARQTPRAVSRDGSPTETSEGETSDGITFPAPLCILSSTFTPPPADSPWTFDVRLEGLTLDVARTALRGSVLVRNIAFTKRVAARFTLDAWQTTSEVAARYVDSLRAGTFDRFEFRVRLADFRRGRVVLCVRYAVSGLEMWDNNSGRNYEVAFERQRQRDSAADLRTRLERVARSAPKRVWLGGDTDTDDDVSLPDSPKDTLSNPTAAPLSTRYDFGKSLKRPAWTPPPSQPAPPRLHTRALSPPIRVREPSPPVSTRRSLRTSEGSGSYFDAIPSMRDTPAVDDDTSTPSVTSASSSPSISPSSPSTTYHAFLDQFCFFTGPGEQGGCMTPRRTHSASSIEDFFSSATPRLGAGADFGPTLGVEYPPSPPPIAG